MLSPASYHLKIPKPHRDNLAKRLAVLRRCRQDAAYREALFAICKRDVVAFVNLMVFQYNPNAIGTGSREFGPFITWDFQDRALVSRDPEEPGVLWCIDNRKDVVIVKSREMGASWLCLLVIVWLYLFHPRKKILVISRNAEAVDRPGDPDSLFWKIDFVLRHLPQWMTEGKVSRRKMGFYNPLNDSAITGQASTGKAGVGGRASLIFVDEFSQIDEDFEVLHRTSDTASCRVFNGTHVGTSKAFYQLTDRKSGVGSYIKRITMHWTQHPDKRHGLYRSGVGQAGYEVIDNGYRFDPDYNFVRDGSPTGGHLPGHRSPWYDEQVRRKASARAAAQDLDIDAAGAASQFFDPIVIRQLKEQYCRPPDWVGDIDFDPITAKPRGLTEASGGNLKLWCPLIGAGVPVPDVYGIGGDISQGTGATPSCLGIINRLGYKVGEYQTAHKGPDEFAYIAVAICWLFATEGGEGARFAWEMNGPGLKFGLKVVELGYRHVYCQVDDFNMKQAVSERPGWSPTPKSKDLLLSDYRGALVRQECINRSWDALEECLAFIYLPNGHVEHSGEKATDNPEKARVNHGDQVVADALAWKMIRSLGLGVLKAPQPSSSRPPVGSLAWRRMQSKAAELEDVYS